MKSPPFKERISSSYVTRVMAQGHMNPRKHLMGSFQSNYDIVEYICKVLSRGDLDGP